MSGSEHEGSVKAESEQHEDAVKEEGDKPEPVGEPASETQTRRELGVFSLEVSELVLPDTKTVAFEASAKDKKDDVPTFDDDNEGEGAGEKGSDVEVVSRDVGSTVYEGAEELDEGEYEEEEEVEGAAPRSKSVAKPIQPEKIPEKESLFQPPTATGSLFPDLASLGQPLVEDLEREESELFKTNEIPFLVEELVDDSVEKSEREDPVATLRARLDRDKLIKRLVAVYVELQKEHRKRYLLNRRLVEYFRRKKYARALAEDNPDTIGEVMKKYREYVLRLDMFKTREVELKKHIVKKLKDINSNIRDLKREVDSNTARFNKRYKDIGAITYNSKTGELIQEKVIEVMIRKMSFQREQISQVRRMLIKMQHRLALLLEEEKKLDAFSDGLRLIDFEQLRAETQGLGDKIEERNNEITKLQIRFKSNTHVAAHCREKGAMFDAAIKMQADRLAEVEEEMNDTRNYLNNLKMEMGYLRKKSAELSFKCGLLDKPILLQDYDRTQAKIEELEHQVQHLRDVKTNGNLELERLEKIVALSGNRTT